MGAATIATVSEVLGTIAEFAKSDGDKTAAEIMRLGRSISEEARRSVMMYKVLVSASVADPKIACKITKWLEAYYAVFTLIKLGYNPTAADNEGIASIIDSVSAESITPVNKSLYETTLIALGRESLTFDPEVNSTSSKPRIGKNAEKSQEDAASKFVTDALRDAQETLKNTKELNELRFMDAIKSSGNAYPTIINMKVRVKGADFVLPIAVKCNLYPVGSEEMRGVVESGLSGKMTSFLRYVKWTSGEISTLAWIFGTDQVERDKKLYAKLGRNPWYRELQERKAMSKANNATWFAKLWGKITGSGAADTVMGSDSYKEIKNMAGYKGEVPPTASLILTTDDLVAASRLGMDHFTKNDGIVKKFMKDSFLLCLGIVDLEAEEIRVFFLGYSSPFIVKFDDLEKQSDSNKLYAEALRELSRKV